ncbi:hypothetical protein [Bacillus sp. PK3_68]|uniref:hypothetical protein n=1 Tax=Bacillus sp. PK3_68 TaxID=2027408 RepID=UPI00217DE135|nr:hypothetical protein [Bacillus sp. PK3_68]
MKQCPLCNSFKELELYCPDCGSQLDDSGKVSDFLDPYGHYNDEETVKMGTAIRTQREIRFVPM